MSRAHMLTIVAAVAAARGIETQTDASVRIKWPNDLFIGDRKAGGILLEVAGEQDVVEWVIVGIGINVNTEYTELPVDLRRSATSLKMATGEPVDRSELLARILLSLETTYKEAQKHGFDRALSEFRQRDYLLKRSVSVQTREGSVIGEATGIDNQGALLVQLPHRHVRRFHSGDVTLH
jgi:BirA family biotin operon repressor/biotin-[acetyl-CoA-carboxylase] ligase